MERPSEGSIIVNNRDIGILPKGKVFQYGEKSATFSKTSSSFPNLTVYDNVSLPLEIRKMTQSEVDYRVRGVLSLVGLGGFSQQSPDVALRRRTTAGRDRPLHHRQAAPASCRRADRKSGQPNRARHHVAFHEDQQMGTTVLIATHDEASDGRVSRPRH